jgi:ABC-type phosphate transport system substrate-binding protein
MIRIIKKAAFLAFCGGLFSTPIKSAAEIAIIAHPDTTVPGVSEELLSRIYLGKAKYLPDGTRAIPIDQLKGSPMRTKFYESVVKLSGQRFNAYWSKRMFNGRGKPPKIIAGDKAILEYIGNKPGAIGYIDGAQLDTNVNVLLILP